MTNILIGKEFNHPKLGLVLVLSKKEKSRTIYLVKQIDRGKGWNSFHNRYIGYRIKMPDGVRWARGENYGYGCITEVHRNELVVTNN